MVNKEEKRVKELFEQIGSIVIHNGAPDFLIFQRDQHGNMRNIKFVEVKSKLDKLKPEQELWREALETCFCEYEVFRPEYEIWGEDKKNMFGKIYCMNCEKDITVTKNQLLSELRLLRGKDSKLFQNKENNSKGLK